MNFPNSVNEVSIEELSLDQLLDQLYSQAVIGKESWVVRLLKVLAFLKLPGYAVLVN
jgi:predicted acetyltransferase